MKYKFKCPLIRCSVQLVTGDRSQLKNIDGIDEKDNFDCFCSEVYGKTDGTIKYFLVWINNNQDYNGMVHETIHLVKKIFEVTNIPFNAENEEIIAYYQNYWVRTFWNKMSKNIKS